MGLLSAPLNMIKGRISDWVKGFLYRYIKDYGTIRDLEIDFMQKIIKISIDLNGEVEPIEVVVKGISSYREAGIYYLSFQSLSISRVWMNDLVKNNLARVLPHNRVEIDSKIGFIIHKIM